MHDPAAVRMREPVEDLRRSFDRLAVAERAAAHRIAERLAPDILIGDVDVTGVGAEAVRAQAALVSEPCSGLRLALGAIRRLPFARDDLERHVEPVSLVARKPDRT